MRGRKHVRVASARRAGRAAQLAARAAHLASGVALVGAGQVLDLDLVRLRWREQQTVSSGLLCARVTFAASVA